MRIFAQHSHKDKQLSPQGIKESFFAEIDCEEKSYILGLLASDGNITEDTVSLFLEERDKDVVEKSRDIVCVDIPIQQKKENLVGWSLHSKEISKDICRHLSINPGEKNSLVKFPHSIPEEFKLDFIRGYFDGVGFVSSFKNKKPYPVCYITSNSNEMLNSIKELADMPCCLSKNRLEWSHNNALDFLGKIYENASIFLKRKKDLYIGWCTWVPSLSGGETHGQEVLFKWNKTHKDAVPPSKSRNSDSGYDLVLLEKIKQVGKVEFYTTGVKIAPKYGWYFDLVPRSSITKSGYILANSVGVIDRTYRGPVLVGLIKIDESMPDLELPNRLVQIIPRPIIHCEFVEVDDLDETGRGEGGFGSTG